MRSYEFDLMGPSYEAAAQVDLELTTHEFAQGEAAWETGTLAFMVSIGSADHHEDTEKDTNLMWKTFALAVLVNLVSGSVEYSCRWDDVSTEVCNEGSFRLLRLQFRLFV